MRRMIYSIIEAIVFALCLSFITKTLNVSAGDSNYILVVAGFLLIWVLGKMKLINILRKKNLEKK